jgi:hypothetical protein
MRPTKTLLQYLHYQPAVPLCPRVDTMVRKEWEWYSEPHRLVCVTTINYASVSLVLIAAASFTAIVTPPGGFNSTTGRAIMAETQLFQAFTTFSMSAFLLALIGVCISASIVPWHKKPGEKIMAVVVLLLWVSSGFLLGAVVCATGISVGTVLAVAAAATLMGLLFGVCAAAMLLWYLRPHDRDAGARGPDDPGHGPANDNCFQKVARWLWRDRLGIWAE